MSSACRRILLSLPLFAAACSSPPPTAAEVYEAYYVPALFGPWADRAVELAALADGDRVLDIACGTGVVARAAAERVGPNAVTGLDIDESMLAVARRIAPEIEWRHGDAQALPFADASFDVVTCQFGLMFFPDRIAAIREMLRVAKPGGRIVVSVWGPLDASPGYATLTRLLAQHMGEDSADALRAPFALGDAGKLAELFASAGGPEPRVASPGGHARFPSIRSWVEAEVRGWVALSQEVDEAELEALIRAAEGELGGCVTATGEVEIPIQAHFVTMTR